MAEGWEWDRRGKGEGGIRLRERQRRCAGLNAFGCLVAVRHDDDERVRGLESRDFRSLDNKVISHWHREDCRALLRGYLAWPAWDLCGLYLSFKCSLARGNTDPCPASSHVRAHEGRGQPLDYALFSFKIGPIHAQSKVPRGGRHLSLASHCLCEVWRGWHVDFWGRSSVCALAFDRPLRTPPQQLPSSLL